MFRARFASTVGLVGLIAAMVVFRLSTPIFLLVSLVALVALWEFFSLQESKGLKVFKKAGLVAAFIFLVIQYLMQVKPFWFGRLEHVGEFAVLLMILFIAGRMVFERERATPVATIALTLFGFFYVPYLFNYISKIIFIGDRGAMDGIFFAAFLVAVTKITDVGAYLVGVRYGRHQMSPRISPKKSWEGFLAGLLSGLGLSLVLVAVLPGLRESLGWRHGIALGLLIPLVSVVGDLAESVVKRDADIKDSGGVIPGIGGCLDLIDSLLYTAPLFYFYVVFFVNYTEGFL